MAASLPDLQHHPRGRTSPARLAALLLSLGLLPGQRPGAPGARCLPHLLPGLRPRLQPGPLHPAVCLGAATSSLARASPAPTLGTGLSAHVSLVHGFLGALPLESLSTHWLPPTPPPGVTASSLGHSPGCRELSRRQSPQHLPAAGLVLPGLGPCPHSCRDTEVSREHHPQGVAEGGVEPRPSCVGWVFARLWFRWSSVMPVHWKRNKYP